MEWLIIDTNLRSVLTHYLRFMHEERIELLPVSGLTGESWRLQGTSLDFLARETNEQKMQLGIDRRREFRLLRKLNGSGLAPNSQGITAGWLLVKWLPGEPMNTPVWQQALTTGTLAAILARLHQRQRSGYPLNLQTRYARYWQTSDPARRSPSWLRLHKQFLRQRPPAVLRQALLHMDIHQGNVLHHQEGSLKLIDWEYAGDGDVALELAALFYGNDLSTEARECLLADYVKLMPGLTSNRLRRQINAWRPWFNYLMLLWYETRWSQTVNREFIAMAAPLRQYFNLSG